MPLLSAQNRRKTPRSIATEAVRAQCKNSYAFSGFINAAFIGRSIFTVHGSYTPKNNIVLFFPSRCI